MSSGLTLWLKKTCSYPFWMGDDEKGEDGYLRTTSELSRDVRGSLIISEYNSSIQYGTVFKG